MTLPTMQPKCHASYMSGMAFFDWQGSIAEAKSETRAEVRRARRQRKLDQIEIPEDQVVIFEEELLGKGGFGKVFLAEYDTRNAAAKVCM